ncbi:MAG: signal peptidase [Bryobacterales bacterium]|nr:signal peptidase [Bryobacterales bacterium]
MKPLSKIPPIAAGVAFLLAGIGLLSALQQLALGVFALVPLAAGIGILRKSVWSAYGFALFELAQLVVSPILLSRTGTIPKSQLLFALGLNAALVVLYYFAGRILAAGGGRRGWAAPWIAIACVCTLPFLFVQAFVVPSAGMENTLLIGDRVLTRVFPKVRLAHGDIVVFQYPIDRRQAFVKRVIGVPGDRIRIAGGVVYRNGAALKEPYAVHKFVSAGSYRDNFPGDPARSLLEPGSPEMAAVREMLQKHVSDGEVVVPSGKYFVLGDNRDNSLDSRYWGFVDAGDVIGKPFLIYDSQEQGSAAGGKGTLSRRTRWDRIFKPL